MDAAAAALAALEEAVVDDAAAALQRRSEPHYQAIDSRQKLQTLFQQVVASMEARDPSIVSAYSTAIASERLRAGFDLSEVQAAFNVLEEAMWAQALRSITGDERVIAVHAISTSLGAGRDALARAYMASVTSGSLGQGNPDSEDALVATTTHGRVGVLTLQDTAKRNALGTRMVHQIVTALDLYRIRGLRAVVLRSAPGMTVWSSGHDVDELPPGRRDPLAYDDPLEQCMRAIRSLPMPVLAMVRGSVWGGAFDLVLSCDVVIADETATFAITPANLGLPYNTTGLLHFLGRLPSNVVKEMFFTAKPVDARQAERWMAVNHLVPASDLERFTMDVAETMASKAPLALAAVKEQLRVLTDYQPVAAQVYERIQSLRRAAYDSRDYLEGLAAFAEKRQPHFQGE